MTGMKSVIYVHTEQATMEFLTQISRNPLHRHPRNPLRGVTNGNPLHGRPRIRPKTPGTPSSGAPRRQQLGAPSVTRCPPSLRPVPRFPSGARPARHPYKHVCPIDLIRPIGAVQIMGIRPSHKTRLCPGRSRLAARLESPLCAHCNVLTI